jgi:hypothetical protein
LQRVSGSLVRPSKRSTNRNRWGFVLGVGGMSGTYSPLLGFLLPHITCRRQHRLVVLVVIDGSEGERKGRMAIRDAFEGRIQGCKSDGRGCARQSAHRLAHVLSSEVLPGSAGLWCLCCRRPQASGGVRRLATDRDANPCTDGCLTAKWIRAADGLCDGFLPVQP